MLFQQEGTGSWDMGLDGVFHLGSVDCVLHYFLPSLHERRVEVPLAQEVNFPTVASLYCPTIIFFSLRLLHLSTHRTVCEVAMNLISPPPILQTLTNLLSCLDFFFLHREK